MDDEDEKCRCLGHNACLGKGREHELGGRKRITCVGRGRRGSRRGPIIRFGACIRGGDSCVQPLIRQHRRLAPEKLFSQRFGHACLQAPNARCLALRARRTRI